LGSEATDRSDISHVYKSNSLCQNIKGSQYLFAVVYGHLFL